MHESKTEEPAGTVQHAGDIFYDDWALESDGSGEEQQDGFLLETDTLPPQLHPAVALGIRRVSSGYFSIHSEGNESVTDLLSILDDQQESLDQEDPVGIIGTNETRKVQWNLADVLYHDIMVQVLSFLDLVSLKEFSQTARRPNFECFYFLQLQLEQALLFGPQNDAGTVAGSGYVSRLAQVDDSYAHEIVQEYTNSNSSLRVMPLSHSIAYMRHCLQRHGFQNHVQNGSPSHALAGAALLVTVVGAASYMSAQDTTALPNTLLKVGVAGSIMRAGVNARKNKENDSQSMGETAKDMARMMQELPSQILRQLEHSSHSSQLSSESLMSFPSSVASRIYTALSSACENNKPVGRKERRGKYTREEERNGSAPDQPVSANPYDNRTNDDDSESDKPSGCVGAYFVAVGKARATLTKRKKQERRARFEALPEEEKRDLSVAFIQACSSDDSLQIVRDMVQLRQCIDVDGFFVASDGSTTCGLHTAAFQGAWRVLEFLCCGIDEHSSGKDGGLADVNVRDDNGWTALHYCAGVNCVPAVRVLASHGAELTPEANNGYTPFHWAQRLSNQDAADELERFGANQRFLEVGWLRQKPLSTIASRLFSISQNN